MPDVQHDEARRRRGELSAEIATGAVQLLSEYTGRGPTQSHAIINRDSVTLVLRDTLTKGERRLVASGKEDEVLRSRYAYQQVMKDDLTALVTRVVGRKVVAFLSANHTDPDVAVEFFLLDSADGDYRSDGSESPD